MKHRNLQWHPDIIWTILLNWYLEHVRRPDKNPPYASDEVENLEWVIHRALSSQDVPACPYGEMDDAKWISLARDALRDTYGLALTENEKNFVKHEISKLVDEVCKMRRAP